jgi:ammonium transporter, Amt family
MSPPTVGELARQVGDSVTAINFVWTLMAAFLVMFMQAGFALVETGLTRAKNVAHTMAMNFLVYSLGVLAYWALGFGLQMGGVGALSTLGGDATLARELTITVAGHNLGIAGFQGFFLPPSMLTRAVAAIFIFQMVFMDTAATIPTGALAERWRFSSFVCFTLVLAGFIYPLYGNWVWGGGWLSALGRDFGLGHGHVDFAGSSVVHLTGGVTAFVGARMLGPRIGKYGPHDRVNPIPAHNVPMVVLGTFVLAFGWFGFNAGSTLAGSDLHMAVVALNTMLASAGGAVSAYLYTKKRFRVPDLSMMCNGMLAGMVAITAPCAFVSAPVAVFIGAVAGMLVIEATLFIERRLRVDDPVGASAVHGVCGTWGVLSVGLFANGSYGEGLNGVPGPVRGLLHGDPGQLAASLIGILTNIVWVGSTVALTLTVLDRLVGNRVVEDVEIEGLDVPEMGMPGYATETSIPTFDDPTNPGGPYVSIAHSQLPSR